MLRKRIVRCLGITVLSVVLSIIYVYPQESDKDEAEVEKILKYGKALYDAEDHKRAIENFLKITCFHPESKYYDEALYMIGESFFNEGRYQKAKDTWERLIKEKPNSVFAEKTKQNIKLLELVMENWEPYYFKLEDKLCDLFIWFGMQANDRSRKVTEFGVVFEDKEFKEALRWYQLAIEMFPNSIPAPKCQFIIGESYRARATRADYEKAIEEYKKTVETYPKTVWANRALKAIGDMCRDNLGDKKRAIEAYQQLIDRNKHIQNSYWVSYAETQIAIIK